MPRDIMIFPTSIKNNALNRDGWLSRVTAAFWYCATMEENHFTQAPWSVSPPKSQKKPFLTSQSCYDGLVHFFEDRSSFHLQVATESSSHLSGLDSLFAQPWVYAGGGLGNIDECPLQTCLAGGDKRDSLTFASVCVVPECTATDLAAPDFPGRMKSASLVAKRSLNEDLVNEYIALHERIAEVNKFLGTGWVCGEYVVQWQLIPSTVYLLLLFGCFFCSLYGTFRYKARRTISLTDRHDENFVSCEEKKDSTDEAVTPFGTVSPTHRRPKSMRYDTDTLWSAWDMSIHVRRLYVRRSDTAFLDGLKVGSILWVIFGHVMAIQCSSGPGYLNPWSFLPPSGITTTIPGQLLFSSRFAVDTFLCISGFLVVYVLKERLTPSVLSVSKVLAFRILRILPLYLTCLCFWILVTPHLGSGPFWYQWDDMLEPCRQFWWTNILFLNNFLPWGMPTSNTCFYHSWYLAVDVQLFFLFAPWLVLLYNRSVTIAMQVTFSLWLVSVGATAVLTYRNQWSINTFDGISVALFDIEGYAKPHIRAQSYLMGMFVAMAPWSRPKPLRDILIVIITLCVLTALSFVTASGAYARRPCSFEESPLTHSCGSLWSPSATFLYTALSRALWSICIGTLIYYCLHGRGAIVEKILSLKFFTVMAHLSFGAYLIHPIIIFLWQLGEKEKRSFRLLSFFMDFTAVSVLSFVLSAIAALMIEFPFGDLLRRIQSKPRRGRLESSELIPLKNRPPRIYGSQGRIEKTYQG
jgi:peptidoglycan/LPS O-acetylase OafA/YrhL